MSENLTPRQMASRINGAKSRGPITPEGKAISSMNAAKHNIFSSPKVILKNESPAEYEDEIRELTEKYQPNGLEERRSIINYVLNYWRLERIWEMEAEAMNYHMDQIRAEMAASGDFTSESYLSFLALERAHQKSVAYPRLSVYEGRIRLACERSKAELAAILAERRRNNKLETKPEPEAVAADVAQPVPSPETEATPAAEPATPVRNNEPKPPAFRLPGTARNKPCPCGSGQKYKRCCLINPPKAA